MTEIFAETISPENRNKFLRKIKDPGLFVLPGKSEFTGTFLVSLEKAPQPLIVRLLAKKLYFSKVCPLIFPIPNFFAFTFKGDIPKFWIDFEDVFHLERGQSPCLILKKSVARLVLAPFEGPSQLAELYRRMKKYCLLEGFESQYELGPVLGKGSFGEVRMAVYRYLSLHSLCFKAISAGRTLSGSQRR